MFRAAIFDMDGTLIDSERVIMRAWLEAAGALGFPLGADAYSGVIGLNDEESNEMLANLLGGHANLKAVRRRVDAALAPARGEVVHPLKPGSAALLAELHALGVPCAVASSSAVHEIRDRLSRAGVLHYMRAVAGGDEVARGKPDPEVYLLAASRLGISAADCLAFEDSEHGACAALGAGAHVVLVPDLRAPSEAVRAAALQVLGSLAEARMQMAAWFGSVPDALPEPAST